MGALVVEGFGLHTGAAARVALESQPGGAVTFRVDGFTARIDELSIIATERATTVQASRGGPPVRTVEHAFAALGGMSIYDGLSIAVEGPEMPLLDGGAAAWCRALAALGLAPSARPLRVTRPAVLRVGSSSYEFAPAEGVDIEVCIDFDDRRIAGEARWAGAADDFRDRIAPARTFAFERDIEEFVRRGLARHVAPDAVVVLTPSAVLSSGAAFSPDEPARHKLLDVIGDFYIHGGPAKGHLRAVRPGHAANERAFSRARADGILAFA
jgi:UDP-3-O-[3-hydroxymyristoyl] N-acetylglucosamine deacetylase